MAFKEYVSRYRWMALAIAFLAQMSNALSAQSIPPLAPLFQPELGLTKAQIGIFSSAAFAGAWGALVVAGILTDRFGARKMMALGQLLTGAMMLGMAAVGSYTQAVIVMLAAGVGRATTLPGCTKAILEWFSPTARGTAMGVKQSAVPLGGVATALTVPVLGLAFGWRVAVAAVGLWIISYGVITALLYRDAASTGTGPSRKVGVRTTMSQIIRMRSLWLVSLMALLFSLVQLAVSAYLALYFKEVMLADSIPDEGARIVAAGGFLALCQSGGAFGRICWGVVSDRVAHGRRSRVLAVVGTLSALMSLAMAFLPPSTPLWLLTVVVFAYGMGASGWAGLYHAVIVEMTGSKQAATVVGMSATVMQIGTIVGPPTFGLVVDLSGSYRMGWLYLFSVASCCVVMAATGARGERAHH